MKADTLEFQRRISTLFAKNFILLALLLSCAFLAIILPHFLTASNLLNVLRQASILGIISIGTTFVIIGNNFDVSVGSVLALCGALVIGLQDIMPWGPALAVTLGSGALIGLINGFLAVKIRIPSIIVTLSMMSIIRGAVYLYTNGYPLTIGTETAPGFAFLGQGNVGSIPFPVILFLLLVGIGQFVLVKTRFGRYVCAVGGNKEAARLSGVPVDRCHIFTFVIGGTMAAIAGSVYASRLLSVSPLAGQGYEMDAIAATVIGGTSVSGGAGSVVTTLIGVILLSLLSNVFNLLGMQVSAQYIIKGAIILIAVGLDSYSKKVD